ncbi:MAG: DUF58 domain-containing protein [Planctomycetota bacterium]|nr:MAG: DUF58 domain-containing protein [Planctomycetota bacterium]
MSDEVRARIARLDLAAQGLVEGPLTGLHKSPYQGFSVEFAQHREYTWGDELKHLDWKVFARTDRYYVKQYEEETNLQAHVLLDASESMAYQGSRALCGKYEYAATLTAGLCFLFLRQQDALGLSLFAEEEEGSLPPSAHPAQLRRVCELMAGAEVRAESGHAPIFARFAERPLRRGIVFVISDLLFPSEGFLAGLRRLRTCGHEVVVYHVLDPDEVDFPFDEATLFEGLEAGPELLTDPRALRDAYLARMRAFQEQLEEGCRGMRVDYVYAATNLSPGVALARYLTQRKRRGRRARG